MSDEKFTVKDVGHVAYHGDLVKPNLNFFAQNGKPALVFKYGDDGKVCVEGEMTDEAVAALSIFVDKYNAGITKDRLEATMLRSMIPNIMKALIAAAPRYGEPGSRDVDVSHRRAIINRTVAVLSAYERGDEKANSLLAFYDWCTEKSSSPGDRYHQAWAVVDTYLKTDVDHISKSDLDDLAKQMGDL